MTNREQDKIDTFLRWASRLEARLDAAQAAIEAATVCRPRRGRPPKAATLDPIPDGRQHAGACPPNGKRRGECFGVCEECKEHKIATPEFPEPHCEWCDACWNCGGEATLLNRRHVGWCALEKGVTTGVPFELLMRKVQARIDGNPLDPDEYQEEGKAQS